MSSNDIILKKEDKEYLKTFFTNWDILLESSRHVAKGTPIIYIKKGKESILQTCLMRELENINYKSIKEFPISPMYTDTLGHSIPVGERTSLCPDIYIYHPYKCIIECKHGLCPEAVHQLRVYLDHQEDINMGCTMEWYTEKNNILIESTLLVRNKDDKNQYFKETKTIETNINRNDDFIEL